MNGQDGEELAERPVIEYRLEHRKIADVLIAQRRFELLHLIGHVTNAAMHIDDLMRDLPINGVDLRLRFEIEQAEIESLLCFLLYLLDVVQALETISALEALFHVEDVTYQFVIFLAGFDFQ